MASNWKPYLGKRVLVRRRFLNSLIEVTVSEIAPSGERVKFQYPNGHKSWESHDHYTFVEMLGTCQATWTLKEA